VAGGGPAALYAPWAVGFEKQDPGITVQVRGAFQQPARRRHRADGCTAAPRLPASRSCRRRRTSRGGRRRARCSRPTSRPRNTWRRTGTTGATCRPACTGWATATTRPRSPPGRSPGRPPGYTGPRWRGRVISNYPHQDDVTLYLYSVIAERHGWSFTGQLLASSPQFVNGHLGVAQGLAAGTAALSFDHIISLGAADRRADRLAVTIPAGDPMPAWPQNAAILDRSPSPAAATLFLRWLLEPDQQNAIARGGAWSPRLDIAPQMGQYFAELVLRPGVIAARRRRTGLPGPARGTHRAGHRPGIPLSPASSPCPSACR
jgi:hypothetical protein